MSGSSTLKYFFKKQLSYNSIASKNFLIKVKTKIFYDKQKLKKCIANRPAGVTPVISNVKQSLSGRRKMIVDRNNNLQKGIQNIRNSNYMGKYTVFFSYYVNFFKRRLIASTKNNDNVMRSL